MLGYKISYIGDKGISNIHHIGIDYNGNYYSVIFGKYVNGGFLVFQIGIVAANLLLLMMYFGMQSPLVKQLKVKELGKQ